MALQILLLSPIYVELHKTFPDAKFIYTIRNKEKWLDGCERHWRSISAFTHETDDPEKEQFKRMARFVRVAVYGIMVFDRDRFSHVYDRHEKNVRDYFANYPDSLIILTFAKEKGGRLFANSSINQFQVLHFLTLNQKMGLKPNRKRVESLNST